MAQIPLQTADRASITNEISAQTCINFQPITRQNGTRTKKGYLGCPGLSSFCNLATGSLVRGIKADFTDTYLYAVSGTSLFQVATNGSKTTVGTVAAGNRVCIEIGINQVFVACTDSNNAYIFNPSNSAFHAVTDVNYASAVFTTTQDTYLIYTPANQSAVAAGRFYLSNATDFSSFNQLQFATEETIADPLQGCISVTRDLWLIGTKSTGVWYDAGSFVPFEQRTFIQRGCKARYTIAAFDGMIAFLGDNIEGRTGVYAGGVQSEYQLTEITNQDVAYQINSYAVVSDAYAFFYTEAGHLYYQITFPTQNVTWVYDFVESEWFQKQNYLGNCHQAYCSAAFNGMNLVGDALSGNIYDMSLANIDDFGNPTYKEIVHPQLYSDNKWQRVSRVQYDISAGVGTSSSNTPILTLYTSKDSGHTYDSGRQLTLGAQAQYQTRAFSTRFGAAKVFQWKVSTISDNRIYLSSMSIEYDVGGL